MQLQSPTAHTTVKESLYTGYTAHQPVKRIVKIMSQKSAVQPTSQFIRQCYFIWYINNSLMADQFCLRRLCSKLLLQSCYKPVLIFFVSFGRSTSPNNHLKSLYYLVQMYQQLIFRQLSAKTNKLPCFIHLAPREVLLSRENIFHFAFAKLQPFVF